MFCEALVSMGLGMARGMRKHVLGRAQACQRPGLAQKQIFGSIPRISGRFRGTRLWRLGAGWVGWLGTVGCMQAHPRRQHK